MLSDSMTGDFQADEVGLKGLPGINAGKALLFRPPTKAIHRADCDNQLSAAP
jgi:hypothetical protein